MDLIGQKKYIILVSGCDNKMHKNREYTKWLLTLDDHKPKVYFETDSMYHICLYVSYKNYSFLKPNRTLVSASVKTVLCHMTKN